jgi:hypothetical protein
LGGDLTVTVFVNGNDAQALLGATVISCTVYVPGLLKLNPGLVLVSVPEVTEKEEALGAQAVGFA